MRSAALLQLVSVLIPPPRTTVAASCRNPARPPRHSASFTSSDAHRRHCELPSMIRCLSRFETRRDMSSPHPKLGRESHHVPNAGAESRGPPLLPRRSGARKDWPFTWDEIRRIVANKEFYRLRRNKAQQRRYEAYQNRVQKSWKSVYDHVLCQKFHLDRRKDEATGLWCAVPPPLHDDDSAANLSLVRNLFPYHMEKGIEHYVLWKLGGRPGTGISKEEIEASISGLRKKQTDTKKCGSHGDVSDVLYWVNPPSLQSLRNIRHAHVLCLTGASRTRA